MRHTYPYPYPYTPTRPLPLVHTFTAGLVTGTCSLRVGGEACRLGGGGLPLTMAEVARGSLPLTCKLASAMPPPPLAALHVRRVFV